MERAGDLTIARPFVFWRVHPGVALRPARVTAVTADSSSPVVCG